ncbi:hypothetical protein AGMMS49942_13960 [Spirochaetia bacterium]|nr:hypothetical protein AGMMS49942_13960 [Spirochaetia bacterium]
MDRYRQYGVQSRYPTEMQIEKEDMTRSLGYAKTIKQFIQLQAPDIFRNDDNNKEPPHA